MRRMTNKKTYKINSMCLYKEGLMLEKSRTLILSDLHFGYYDTTLTGVRFLDDSMERIRDIVEVLKPTELILNGDITHHFGKISGLAKKNLRELKEYLDEKKIKLTLIQGNHDTLLEYYLKDLGINKKDIKERIIKEKILICHGDKIINTKGSYNRIIIGHEHPHIKLKEGVRTEDFKCYLFSKCKGKDLIVMPAFSPYSAGNSILERDFLSPYLKKAEDYEESKVLLVDDVSKKIRDFGRIKDIQEIYE